MVFTVFKAGLPDVALAKSGISAKNLKRPGVQRVLNLARKEQVDAIVVYKLDRIFRSTTDALETTKLFEKWYVSFHSIEETLDTQSAMGRFFFTLTAALAEMERRIIGKGRRRLYLTKGLVMRKQGKMSLMVTTFPPPEF